MVAQHCVSCWGVPALCQSIAPTEHPGTIPPLPKQLLASVVQTQGLSSQELVLKQFAETWISVVAAAAPGVHARHAPPESDGDTVPLPGGGRSWRLLGDGLVMTVS